jgi:threonine/homoserine/homoserine lactone efflux protein
MTAGVVAPETLSPIVAAVGVGVALAGAPGPVQAVLLSEAVRGGVPRGFRAWAGSTLTFGSLLLALALGLSLATPAGLLLRTLKVAGGALLLWLAVDAIRSRYDVPRSAFDGGRLNPTIRGSMAILFNPGGWLFLAAVASPLLASATRAGGRATAVVTALALLAGAGLGDVGVVLLGGVGLRRARPGIVLWAQRVLAAVLAALGSWLIIQAVS